jgi:Bacterial protein of unknown function (DUF937)
MNIVSLVMNFLTPDVTAKIASALGLDRSLAQKAIGAAVPSLLAGIVGLGSKPEGARQLANAIGQQDTGLLQSFAGLLGGAKQGDLISGGTSALSGLLGGSALGSLTGAVAKFSGIGEGASKSLLGLLGPVVLGQLGKQKVSGNLDANGLATLLDEQKKNISSAIPSGFSDLLKGTNVLSAVSGSASREQTTGQSRDTTGQRTTQTSGGTTSVGQRSIGSIWAQWPLWLLAALAAGLFHWYFLGDGQQLRQASVAPAARPIMVGDVDVSRQTAAAADQLAITLRGIRDTSSAQAALPRLLESAGQLNRINDLTGKMQPEGRRSLAQYLGGFMSTLRPLLTSVQAIPGLPDSVRTTLNAIAGRLDGLSRI